MHHHRRLALTVGALLLTAPVLTGCGFNYGTDRVNTTTNATFNRDKSVDVIGAQVISAAPGSGSLHGRLINNSEKPTELVSVTGAGDVELTAGTVTTFEIGVREAVNVEDVGEGVRVDGDFIAGENVPMTLTFSNGDEVKLEVPIVRACDFFEGLDTAPAIAAAGSATPPTETEPYSCEAPESGTE